MNKVEVGKKVVLAANKELIFTVQKKNLDGSFEITAQVNMQNTLTYNHVSAEMLRVVDVETFKG